VDYNWRHTDILSIWTRITSMQGNHFLRVFQTGLQSLQKMRCSHKACSSIWYACRYSNVPMSSSISVKLLAHRNAIMSFCRSDKIKLVAECLVNEIHGILICKGDNRNNMYVLKSEARSKKLNLETHNDDYNVLNYSKQFI